MNWDVVAKTEDGNACVQKKHLKIINDAAKFISEQQEMVTANGSMRIVKRETCALTCENFSENDKNGKHQKSTSFLIQC